MLNAHYNFRHYIGGYMNNLIALRNEVFKDMIVDNRMAKKKKCLRCHHVFMVTNKGNRICASCTLINAKYKVNYNVV